MYPDVWFPRCKRLTAYDDIGIGKGLSGGARFFDELARITDTSTPDIASWPVILLVVLSVGGWMVMPFLVIRRIAFGYYLAWTAFAAFGISELAHILIFPFMTGEPYGYFPGMATVFLLAPVAWWGMVRLARGRQA